MPDESASVISELKFNVKEWMGTIEDSFPVAQQAKAFYRDVDKVHYEVLTQP